MTDASPEPFGKLLLDARTARGMTLAEVSASTKIPVSKLQAIERDDIENLPGGIFTRGFVRSYAETVGLDPQDTLAEFEARFPDESSVATLHATIEGRANEEFVRRQRTAKSVVWLALLAVPLVLWVLSALIPGDAEAPAPERVVAAGAEPAIGTGSEPPPPQPPTEPSEEPAPPPPVESPSRPDPAPTEAVEPGRLTMEMSATADCWVQASADGDRVVSRLLRAGERELIVAQEEIDLRVGDAGACGFTINERPGRSLGESGEVVDIRVTQANYLSFVAE
ncbi:MAG: DUF4115 domain-containing protein [Acidobacteria bacterium]|nr:DUF4115 domain-containing protein [Acidobacteriota bacterium]